MRYLYAEPNHCVCIFIGTRRTTRTIAISSPGPQADDCRPDYKTQASALLYGDPYDWNNLNQPDSVADYLPDVLLKRTSPHADSSLAYGPGDAGHTKKPALPPAFVV